MGGDAEMSATTWTRTTAWVSGLLLLCSCTEGTQFKSAGLCKPGELKCLGGDVYACNQEGSQFDLHQTCVGGTVCFDGECEFPTDAGPDSFTEQDGMAGELPEPACSPDACASLMGDAPACRRWDCGADLCILGNVQNGTPCSDANACTISDACQEGQCIGAQDDCDDNFNCTIDQCDASSGCSNKVNHKACDDGNPCTEDTCSGVSGCIHTALTGAACDDGDVCSVGDHCTAGGTCMPTEMAGDITCITPADCIDDGWDLCQGHPQCAKVGCDTICLTEANTQVSCPPSDNTCTTNLCNPATGQCEMTPADDGQECEDGDPCTMGDYCDNALCLPGGYGCGYCLKDEDCKQFEDGDACNGSLVCDIHDFPSTMCVVDPATMVSCDTAGDSQCEKAACDPSSGICQLQPVAGGIACQGPAECYSAWTCDGNGECEGEPVDCDDDNPCTDDFCDAASGECVQVPIDPC